MARASVGPSGGLVGPAGAMVGPGIAGAESVEPFSLGIAGQEITEPFNFGDLRNAGRESVEIWSIGEVAGNSMVEPWMFGPNVGASSVEPFNLGTGGVAMLGSVTPAPASPQSGWWD